MQDGSEVCGLGQVLQQGRSAILGGQAKSGNTASMDCVARAISKPSLLFLLLSAQHSEGTLGPTKLESAKPPETGQLLWGGGTRPLHACVHRQFVSVNSVSELSAQVVGFADILTWRMKPFQVLYKIPSTPSRLSFSGIHSIPSSQPDPPNTLACARERVDDGVW